MSKKGKYLYEILNAANAGTPVTELSATYGIHPKTISRWIEEDHRPVRFLADKVARHDVAVIQVVSLPAPQMYRAILKNIYSRRRALLGISPGSEIQFVGCPGSWGQEILRLGDTALLFLSDISGRLYEDAWYGHLPIEDIDSVPHASYPFKELWLRPGIPESIRTNSVQDPRRPWASAIRFDALQDYLTNLILGRD